MLELGTEIVEPGTIACVDVQSAEVGVREVGGEWGDVAEGAFEEFVGGIGRDGGGFGYHDSYYFIFLIIMMYSLVMILGWVDQIGRKGNIFYSSSCSLSFVPLSLYT